MVSFSANSPDPSQESDARRQLAEKLAQAAMIMAGFGPPEETIPEKPPVPCFPLGKTYATAAVTRWAEENGVDLADYLRRHHHGDWGDLDAEDKQANEDALENGSRIFSSYKIGDRKIYCITEADRSMTTLLFANEY